MFVMGLVDDLRRLTPPTKLLFQILAASLVIFFGGQINFFPWGFANIILTFFWLLGITNAMNLLDNMDGLAGGVALIASGFLSYFFIRAQAWGLLLFSTALAGSILGFLVFNFPPAKIIMGDVGSMFLGFSLAALAVSHRPRASDVFTVMGVPVLLFLLPIIDTTLVTITRLLRGQSPAQGGTDHTSHRLIAFGLSERQTVLVLYTVGLLSGLTGAVLEALDYDLSLVLAPFLLISLALLTAYLGHLKVVSTVRANPGGITRLMIDLTYKRRVLEMILDFFIIGFSYYLAFWTQFGLRMDSSNLTSFLRTLPVALAAAYISFFLSGVYRAIWRYTGVEDLVLYLRATLGAVVLTAAPLVVIDRSGAFSPVIYFLFGIFLFLGMALARSSFHILDRVYSRQQVKIGTKTVLIYGAEDAGELALRWILRHPELGYHPIGFIDNDPLTWGRRIHGLEVLGGCEKLEEILNGRGVEGVIVTASGLLSNGHQADVVDAFQKKGLWVRLLKLEFELVE
jgi:UDP-GlcNAc:undecaprenyl-phosphate GlcNAc-1-phosphate transferase